MRELQPGDIVRLKWTNRIAPSMDPKVRRLAVNNVPLVVVQHLGEARPFYFNHRLLRGDYDCWEVLVDGEVLVVSERDLTHRGPFNVPTSEMRRVYESR